jgi:8-oxo-dGTP pyrophosphatase MutT (NUDIX family)
VSDLLERRRGKAYGYVIQDDRLLVFREIDFPAAGLQVPGGTLEPGEDPLDGLVRELTEETGRADFVVHDLVGRHTFIFERDGVRHIHDRHFFHVTPNGPWPARWRNFEESPDSGDPPVLFEFLWLPLTDPIELAVDLGQALAALAARLGAKG